MIILEKPLKEYQGLTYDVFYSAFCVLVWKPITVFSAGIGISLRALSSGTSQLPAIPLNAPANAIGTNTVDSMQSGTVLGAAAMIEGLCARLEEDLGEKIETIVATGGISGDIIRYCRMDIIHDPNLILDGLRFILEKNTI